MSPYDSGIGWQHDMQVHLAFPNGNSCETYDFSGHHYRVPTNRYSTSTNAISYGSDESEPRWVSEKHSIPGNEGCVPWKPPTQTVGYTTGTRCKQVKITWCSRHRCAHISRWSWYKGALLASSSWAQRSTGDLTSRIFESLPVNRTPRDGKTVTIQMYTSRSLQDLNIRCSLTFFWNNSYQV